MSPLFSLLAIDASFFDFSEIKLFSERLEISEACFCLSMMDKERVLFWGV
ncbi:hypothetical protein OIU77_013319 [Salix suchowensis]|uniref:AraC family transcriptional regulator n=1 Tax=Salix suchowensis TaxID=1278906 RepID=A0ABQ8ZTF7_9ROSI|nr:hypothetical protein OIU77_013319 [Salix suchowensis]